MNIAKNPDIQKEIITGIFTVMGIVAPIIITYLLYDKKKRSNSQHIKLIYHPVLARLKAYKNYLNLDFTIKNKGKEVVFKDLLINNIDTWSKTLYELAEEVESCIEECPFDADQECNKLYNVNMEYLQLGIERFGAYYKNSNYTREEQDLLDIVMGKFNKWYSHRIQYVENSLLLVCNSKFYGNCYTKQAVIFDMYLGMFADMLGDAEKTLNDINGDLTGRTFRGITI